MKNSAAWIKIKDENYEIKMGDVVCRPGASPHSIIAMDGVVVDGAAFQSTLTANLSTGNKLLRGFRVYGLHGFTLKQVIDAVNKTDRKIRRLKRFAVWTRIKAKPSKPRIIYGLSPPLRISVLDFPPVPEPPKPPVSISRIFSIPLPLP